MVREAITCWVCSKIDVGEPCCPRCLAPFKRGLSPDAATARGWLLGLYGHNASLGDHGPLVSVLLTRCRDDREILACVDLVRTVQPAEVVARWRSAPPPPNSLSSLGLDRALEQLEADHAAGVLAWRLDQIARHCTSALARERGYYERSYRERDVAEESGD